MIILQDNASALLPQLEFPPSPRVPSVFKYSSQKIYCHLMTYILLGIPLSTVECGRGRCPAMPFALPWRRGSSRLSAVHMGRQAGRRAATYTLRILRHFVSRIPDLRSNTTRKPQRYSLRWRRQCTIIRCRSGTGSGAFLKARLCTGVKQVCGLATVARGWESILKLKSMLALQWSSSRWSEVRLSEDNSLREVRLPSCDRTLPIDEVKL